MENSKQVQIQPANETVDDGLITGFFAIGIVVNILLIIAYIIWAVKQWGKKEKRDQ